VLHLWLKEQVLYLRNKNKFMQRPVGFRRATPARASCAGNAESVSFANHIRRFDPLNHRPGGRCRSGPLHGAQPPLHVMVIGFVRLINNAEFAGGNAA
jgi:hypothetical protein